MMDCYIIAKLRISWFQISVHKLDVQQAPACRLSSTVDSARLNCGDLLVGATLLRLVPCIIAAAAHTAMLCDIMAHARQQGTLDQECSRCQEQQ
jgi:hypothetical protein